MVNFSRITSSYKIHRLFYENLLSFVQVLKTIFPAAILTILLLSIPHFVEEVGNVEIETYCISCRVHFTMIAGLNDTSVVMSRTKKTDMTTMSVDRSNA
jgi:hypothetical protein